MKAHAPWPLPWKNADVPHAIVDIIRGCNITCGACYNTLPPHAKTLAEIEAEVDGLCRLRRLASVSLVGGETLLHPELLSIIRLLKKRRLYVELFTNGVLLDAARLAQLKEAGADMLFLHIERSQSRPDLPARPTAAQLRDCWAAKTALVAQQGLEAGLTLTVNADNQDELAAILDFVVASEHATYLLVTLQRDLPDTLRISGNLATGLRTEFISGDPGCQSPPLTNADMRQFMARGFGVQPFARIGSNVDAGDLRWLSYLLVTAHQPSGAWRFQHLIVSWFERAFLALHRRLTSCYPMYRRQSSRQVLAQLILNGLTGGGLRRNMAFLWQTLRPGTRYRTKRILFQQLAQVDAIGRVVHCLPCPDAVYFRGGLVPVCLLDKCSTGEE